MCLKDLMWRVSTSVLLSSCDMIYLPADEKFSWLLSVVDGPLLALL